MSTTSFELCSEITTTIRPRIDFILDMWSAIGFSSDVKKVRCREVVTFIDDIMKNMGIQEQELLDRIKHSINKIKDDISKLNEELGEFNEIPSMSDSSICEFEIKLIDVRKKLLQMKTERVEKKKILQQEEQLLCDLLCDTPNYLVSGLVPTQHDLDQLKYHIVHLKETKQQRLHDYLEKKIKVTQLFSNLERVAETSFQRQVTCSDPMPCEETGPATPDPNSSRPLSPAISDETIMLTNDNIRMLDHLVDELEKQRDENECQAKELRNEISSLTHRLQTPREEYEHLLTDCIRPSTLIELRQSVEKYRSLHHNNMECMITNARSELTSLWNKCYTSQESQTRFYEDTGTGSEACEICEEVLLVLEQEVTRMNDYYTENMSLLKMVAKRMLLWDQHCEMQRNEANPDRFFDRKCNLLKESKERNKIYTQLTKIQKELIGKINEWETYNNREFKVDNQPFLLFCEQQEQNELLKKNAEKEERAIAKNKKNRQESLFGSKPAKAPAKRKFLTPSASILKTPTKSKRLNGTKATPMSTPMTTPLRSRNVNQLNTPNTRSSAKKKLLEAPGSSSSAAKRQKLDTGISASVESTSNCNATIVLSDDYTGFVDGVKIRSSLAPSKLRQASS